MEDEVAWMIFGIEFQFLGQNVNRIDDLSRFNQLLPAGRLDWLEWSLLATSTN